MAVAAEVVRSVRVPNPAGLHARPCHAVATLAQRYHSPLRVACGDLEVDGRSILELMTLCAPCESTLTLRSRGADARELVDAVAGLVEAGFGEMP
jgi:phosphotransferase system HPr (HPr) family protein